MHFVWDPVSILDTILERYGWLLGGFWEDFGWVVMDDMASVVNGNSERNRSTIATDLSKVMRSRFKF